MSLFNHKTLLISALATGLSIAAPVLAEPMAGDDMPPPPPMCDHMPGDHHKGDHMRGGQQGEHPMMRQFMEKRWEKLDTNHDGALSKEEYLKEASDRFDMTDANHDGKITKEEVKAFFEKVRTLEMEAHKKAEAEVQAKLKQGN